LNGPIPAAGWRRHRTETSMGHRGRRPLTIMACFLELTPVPAKTSGRCMASAGGREGPDDEGPLLFALTENFYGTTVEGGAHGGPETIFQFTLRRPTDHALPNFCALPELRQTALRLGRGDPGARMEFLRHTIRGGANMRTTACSTVCPWASAPSSETQQTGRPHGSEGSHPRQ